MKLKPNDPCTCGYVDPSTKQPLKYKRCCGDLRGDWHFVVQNSDTGEILTNDIGKTLVFTSDAVAKATARKLVPNYTKLEVVFIPEIRWNTLKVGLDYVLVKLKDFDVSAPLPETPPEPVQDRLRGNDLPAGCIRD